jgi:CheY-like chemotaxis protein
MRSHQLVVLLVEDDPGDALIATEALERATGISSIPHDIHVVGDGLQAMAFLRGSGEYVGAARPGLILLDLNMPRMDGREALALIKQDPSLRSIPVVVFTTSAAEADVMACYQAHANAYVTKPMELDDLECVVAQIGAFFTSVARLPSPV